MQVVGGDRQEIEILERRRVRRVRDAGAGLVADPPNRGEVPRGRERVEQRGENGLPFSPRDDVDGWKGGQGLARRRGGLRASEHDPAARAQLPQRGRDPQRQRVAAAERSEAVDLSIPPREILGRVPGEVSAPPRGRPQVRVQGVEVDDDGAEPAAFERAREREHAERHPLHDVISEPREIVELRQRRGADETHPHEVSSSAGADGPAAGTCRSLHLSERPGWRPARS